MLRPLEQVPNRFDGVPPDDRDRRTCAEAALNSGEPSHLLIVDPVPALIAAMTSAGQVEHGNRQVYEHRRRTLGELKTRGIADVVHPVDPPRVIVFVSAHDDAVMRANALRAGADRILEDAVRQQHTARRSTSNLPQVANFRMGASGRRAPLQNTQKEHRISRPRLLVSTVTWSQRNRPTQCRHEGVGAQHERCT